MMTAMPSQNGRHDSPAIETMRTTYRSRSCRARQRVRAAGLMADGDEQRPYGISRERAKARDSRRRTTGRPHRLAEIQRDEACQTFGELRRAATCGGRAGALRLDHLVVPRTIGLSLSSTMSPAAPKRKKTMDARRTALTTRRDAIDDCRSRSLTLP